jgi:antitoxin VapB
VVFDRNIHAVAHQVSCHSALADAVVDGAPAVQQLSEQIRGTCDAVWQAHAGLTRNKFHNDWSRQKVPDNVSNPAALLGFDHDLRPDRLRCFSGIFLIVYSHIPQRIFPWRKWMSLYIRDDSVDALAVQVQKLSNAPSKTEAVRRALQNELRRMQETVPLRDRIRKIQENVKAIGPDNPNFDMKAFTDEMWDEA